MTCLTIISPSPLNTNLKLVNLFFSFFLFFFSFLSFFLSLSLLLLVSLIFKFKLLLIKPFFKLLFISSFLISPFSSTSFSCGVNNLSIAVFLYIAFFGRPKIPLIPFLAFSEITPSNKGFITFSTNESYFASFLFLKNKRANPIKSYNLFWIIL